MSIPPPLSLRGKRARGEAGPALLPWNLCLGGAGGLSVCRATTTETAAGGRIDRDRPLLAPLVLRID